MNESLIENPSFATSFGREAQRAAVDVERGKAVGTATEKQRRHSAGTAEDLRKGKDHLQVMAVWGKHGRWCEEI